MLIALAIIQTLTAAELEANGWEWLANGTSGGVFYVQPFKGPRLPHPKAWYAAISEGGHSIALAEVNCQTWQTRTVQGVVYWSVEGEDRQAPFATSEWTYISPGSISESIAEYVCGD